VERQISQEKSAPSRLRFALGAVAALVVVACLSMWLQQGDQTVLTPMPVAPKPDNAMVANQAETALTFVGSELLHAGAHSEMIISDRAVPPLRNSIEIARNKIIHPMEL